MKSYYVNNNGDHEVHKEGCERLKMVLSKTYLGVFNNCEDAVREAQKTYSNADGCFYCSRECNKH